MQYIHHRNGKPRENHMSVNVLYKTSAKATGGRSYVAADPGKLREVFIDALQNR